MREQQYLDSQYGDNFDTVEVCSYCHITKDCMDTEDDNGSCFCCSDCFGK